MSYTAKQMIVVRRDLHMRKGKIAAQACHACVEAVLMALAKEDRLRDVEIQGDYVGLRDRGREPSPLSEWFLRGVAKICVYVDSEEALHERNGRSRVCLGPGGPPCGLLPAVCGNQLL